MLNMEHLHSITLDGPWRFQLLDRADASPAGSWNIESIEANEISRFDGDDFLGEGKVSFE